MRGAAILTCHSPTPSLSSHSWNLSNESGNVSYDTLGEKKRNRASYKGLLCGLPCVSYTLVFRLLCDLISGSSHTFSHVKKSTFCLGFIFSKALFWFGCGCIGCVVEWCVTLKCDGLGRVLE